jgi:hypothetical protein
MTVARAAGKYCHLSSVIHHLSFILEHGRTKIFQII